MLKKHFLLIKIKKGSAVIPYLTAQCIIWICFMFVLSAVICCLAKPAWATTSVIAAKGMCLQRSSTGEQPSKTPQQRWNSPLSTNGFSALSAIIWTCSQHHAARRLLPCQDGHAAQQCSLHEIKTVQSSLPWKMILLGGFCPAVLGTTWLMHDIQSQK